jgi:tRNA(Ile)-lysidine synthetase-like protein
LNHKLRGAESDEDEKFARNLASKLKLKFFSKKIDVKREAKKSKMSIEEAAREVRYQYLESVAKKTKANKIALGHQADDQAETLLMRLFRGAGAAGLSGIPPKRGKIIRPLIQIREQNQTIASTQNQKGVQSQDRGVAEPNRRYHLASAGIYSEKMRTYPQGYRYKKKGQADCRYGGVLRL